MAIVNMYRYLCILFSTRLSFVAACKNIASKAKKALLHALYKLRMLDNKSLVVFLKIVDAQIQSIMQYGPEIWGLDETAQHCGNLHIIRFEEVCLC